MSAALPFSRPRLTTVPAICVLALVCLVARQAWIADDAFITLRTVDQFVHGRGLVWNTGFRVQTYTHPLWMLLLAGVYAVTREPYYGTLALSLVVTATAALVLFRDVLRNEGARWFALVALASSQAFVHYGTSGLENPLSHLLVLLAYRELAREGRSLPRAALAIGLLSITRHDLVLLVAPFVGQIVLALRSATRGERARTIAALVLPLILWTAFAILYYGVPFPNTAYAKLGGELPRTVVIANGLGYLLTTFVYDLPTAFTILVGIAVGLVGNTSKNRAIAFGILLHLAYVVVAGGDFMRGRFLTAPFLLAVVLVARRIEVDFRSRSTALMVVWLLVLGLGTFTRPANGRDSIDARGIADEREHWAAATGIENATLRAPLPRHVHVDEARTSRARSARGRIVVGVHTAGFTGFYSGARVHLVEWFGLTDPVLARQPAMREVQSRPGHLLRFVDADYMAMVEDAVHDRPFVCRGPRARCALFEDVLLASHAPLFAPGRLGAIVRLSRGAPDWGNVHEQFARPRLVVVALADVATRRAEGTAWNATGVRAFRDDGIAIRLPRASRARAIALSLDHDDRYRVRFERGRTALASVDLEPRHATGLVRHRIVVPAEARGRYTRILVEPLAGDGSYALGDLALAR